MVMARSEPRSAGRSARASLPAPARLSWWSPTMPRSTHGALRRASMSRLEAATVRTSRDPVRVVVIDDHEAVRAGLERVLKRAPGVDLVRAMADDRQLLELARDEQIDVVILDYDLER